MRRAEGSRPNRPHQECTSKYVNMNICKHLFGREGGGSKHRQRRDGMDALENRWYCKSTDGTLGLSDGDPSERTKVEPDIRPSVHVLASLFKLGVSYVVSRLKKGSEAARPRCHGMAAVARERGG